MYKNVQTYMQRLYRIKLLGEYCSWYMLHFKLYNIHVRFVWPLYIYIMCVLNGLFFHTNFLAQELVVPMLLQRSKVHSLKSTLFSFACAFL